jgi:arsenite methyltransferase
MSTGLKNIAMKKEKRIVEPEETLKKYLNKAELAEFRNSGRAIHNMTVHGEKG